MGMDVFPSTTPYLITIPPVFLWAIFAVVLFLYIVMSIIFVYHWNRYGGKNMIILVGSSVYFLVSVVLIAVALFALLSLI